MDVLGEAISQLFHLCYHVRKSHKQGKKKRCTWKRVSRYDNSSLAHITFTHETHTSEEDRRTNPLDPIRSRAVSRCVCVFVDFGFNLREITYSNLFRIEVLNLNSVSHSEIIRIDV